MSETIVSTDSLQYEENKCANIKLCKKDDRSIEKEQLQIDKKDSTAHSNKRQSKKKRETDTADIVSSSIHQLHSEQELDRAIKSNQFVIVEFVASWCGACKSIQDFYNDLSDLYQDSIYCTRIVCDKNKQTKKIATSYNIGSYPVFIVFANEKVVNRWDGADRGKLEATFERQGKGSKFKKKRGGKSR